MNSYFLTKLPPERATSLEFLACLELLDWFHTIRILLAQLPWTQMPCVELTYPSRLLWRTLRLACADLAKWDNCIFGPEFLHSPVSLYVNSAFDCEGSPWESFDGDHHAIVSRRVKHSLIHFTFSCPLGSLYGIWHWSSHLGVPSVKGQLWGFRVKALKNVDQ